MLGAVVNELSSPKPNDLIQLRSYVTGMESISGTGTVKAVHRKGMETMGHDMPPKDDEILDVLRKHVNGLSADELIRSMLASYEEQQIIEALQRVLERGKVDFSPDALLVATPEFAQAA